MLLALALQAQSTPPTKTPPAKSKPATPASTPPAPPASTPPASTPPATTPPATSPASTPGTLPSTVSGRPPEPPLKRVEGRRYEVKLEANIYLAPVARGETAPLQLQAVSAWVPIITQSTWSQVDPDSLQAQLFVQGQLATSVRDRITWKYGLPFGMAAVGMAIGDVSGQSLRWNMSWTEVVWNTQLNDAAAATIAWPQAWPDEVQAALQPQPGIESNAPEFKQFVQRVSGGKLRSVTPFVAAKQLIKATAGSFKTMDNTGLRQENGFTRGLMLQGAYAAMQSGNGSSHDLSAACVAVLRAAGIPARVIVGATDIPASSGVTRTRLITWAEFYLPNAGWVPFDPLEIRRRATALPAPDKAWPSFGTWDDLNERLPLSYTWSAPVPGSQSLPYPAVWSWFATGTISGNAVANDMIGVQLVNRGRVPQQ